MSGEFFGHPRGLAVLFFTEMWERFSYYGMRGILILFMTAAVASGGLGFDVETAALIYGLFTAMVYMAALPGGWIADRLTGQRRAVLYGGALIAGGNFLLAIPNTTAFYGGLTLVVAGTGLLKPNVSVIVGQLYAQNDARRDAGFSIFYMGINLGATLAPIICGWVAEKIYWRYGFVLAGAGMTLGLVQYLLGGESLGAAGLSPATPENSKALRQFTWGAIAIAAMLLITVVLAWQGTVSTKAIANGAGFLLLITVLAFFGWMFGAASWTPFERTRLVAIAVLFFAACVFWSLFEQAGSSMNLFAQRNTDNTIGKLTIPAPSYQSINGFFIVTLAPAFAILWMKLGSREPSSPAKFAWGLGLVGLGFLVLASGASIAERGVRISPMWLLATYLLHTMGELCLSPVGLSAMTKLAPARVGGLMMGVWFLSISIGNYLGGRIAAFYEALPLPILFGAVGLFAVLAGVLLAVFVRPIVRLMAGVR